MAEARVCVGVIVGAQGVRGGLRVKPFTAEPDAVAAYGPVEDEKGERRFQLQLVGRAKGVVVARVPGIDDRDAAEALKGVRLYVPRAALPAPEKEEWYHADLLGLAAILADGTPLGRVRAIHDFGAGDCIEIERDDAAPVMVPFTRAAVPVVDLAAGRLVIEPPEGLLETPENPLPLAAEGKVRGATSGDEPEMSSPRPSPAGGRGRSVAGQG